MTIIDANYILRWFLNDVPEQAVVAEKLLRDAGEGSVYISAITLAEVTYVLRGKGYDHEQIVAIFDNLYYYGSVVAPTMVCGRAFELFRSTNLDFEDCMLAAYHQVKGYDVATFDTTLRKRLNQQ